jgi:pimeloyl-ACP methyl ester carboxylesterase
MATTVREVDARYGTFANSMEYVTFGGGPRTMLFIQGGPGSSPPRGMSLRMTARWFRPFVEAGFAVWIVSRRRGMARGHTVADMADDYAGLIDAEFDGVVDLVVGESYGGMIAQFLAGRHPDRLRYLVLLVSAAQITDWCKDVDRRARAALERGDRRAAGMAFAEYLVPGPRLRWLRRLVGPAVLSRMVPPHPTAAADALVELDAEIGFDARPVLEQITAPVLIVSGDRDRFFPEPIVEQTARSIDRCDVVWYRGKGHAGAASSARTPNHVLQFLARRQR